MHSFKPQPDPSDDCARDRFAPARMVNVLNDRHGRSAWTGFTQSRFENPAAAVERQEYCRHLVKALPRRHRSVVSLYFFEGLTLKEIGRSLGFTESLMSRELADAIQILKELHNPKAVPGTAAEIAATTPPPAHAASLVGRRRGGPLGMRRPTRVVDGVTHYHCSGPCDGWFPGDRFYSAPKAASGIRSKCKRCEIAGNKASQQRRSSQQQPKGVAA